MIPISLIAYAASRSRPIQRFVRPIRRAFWRSLGTPYFVSSALLAGCYLTSDWPCAPAIAARDIATGFVAAFVCLLLIACRYWLKRKPIPSPWLFPEMCACILLGAAIARIAGRWHPFP